MINKKLRDVIKINSISIDKGIVLYVVLGVFMIIPFISFYKSNFLVGWILYSLFLTCILSMILKMKLGTIKINHSLYIEIWKID